MKRKWISIIVTVLLVAFMSANALAAVRSTSYIPSLSFSGTIANCKVTIVANGKSINGKLELWCGNTLIDSWSGSGTSRIVLSGKHSVTRGKTYTLKAYGTINGVSFFVPSVTKVCN